MVAVVEEREQVRRAGRSPLKAGLVVGALAAGTVASILRQPGPGAMDTIWAEDGEIFLTQAVRDGAGAFTTSYAGYYHLVARMVAGVAALLPPSQAAAALAVGAALVTTVFAIAAYALSGEYISSTVGRLVVSVPVAVLPMAQGDVLNSPANLHWTGLYVLFWFLLCRPSSTAGKILTCAGIVLVVGSDILTGVYLPLVAFVLWFHRDRYAVAKAVAFVVPLAVQVLGLLTGASEREGLAPDPVRAVTGFVLRAVPTALFGERWVGQTVSARSMLFAAVAWLLIAAVLVLGLRKVTRPRWTLVIAAGVHSALVYIAPVALSGIATPRYNVAPALLVLVTLVALLNDVTGVRALAALLLVVCAVNFRVDNARADGPDWHTGLRTAETACAADPAGTATVEVTPLAAPGWHVALPCDYVDRN
ncbi:hypothetical protein OHA72_00980 [Dactylosporangium sp. NBC_01737]|uniref:hypothetical protein n=1 Tax=Dactylosporangium sp. NBC_01737 TaxID=2975959 RepID=UPI002E0DCE69|nr:hypothetical protein OHA72_00980 [Dactylosporangium sp. NBC_01737]